jgi:hypothetical protein
MNLKSAARGIVSAAATVLIVATGAFAVLGEPADTITSDSSAMGIAKRVRTPRTGYAVHELQSGALTVREFVSTSGIVFAVAWEGIGNPDLPRLLGNYFGEYIAAKKAPRTPGRRSHAVRSERVVVERWGHMRNMQGRAYVPLLHPPGVNTDEIR